VLFESSLVLPVVSLDKLILEVVYFCHEITTSSSASSIPLLFLPSLKCLIFFAKVSETMLLAFTAMLIVRLKFSVNLAVKQDCFETELFVPS